MVRKESVIVNFLFQFIYQIFVTLVPIVTAPYLARTLGVNGVGVYAYNYAIAYYFVLFTKLGIDNYGTKEIAKIDPDNKESISAKFNELFTAKAIIGAISLLVYLIYVYCFAAQYRQIALIFSLYIVSAIIDINWFYIGIENFKFISLRNIIVKLITTICIFVFVKSKNDLPIYTLIMVGGTYFLSQFIGWGYILKNIRLKLPKLQDVIRHYKSLLILFIPVLAMSIYRQMDKIMLGGMVDTFQVGLYEYTEKIYMVLMCIVSVTGDVGMPRVVHLLSRSENEKAKNLINYFMDFGICLSIAMSFGISAISKHFIALFYGREFSKCASLLVLLAPTIIFLCVSVIIRKEYLIPYGNEKVFVRATVIGAFINFMLNLMLIPSYKAEGAVIATLSTELFVMIYQIIFIRKFLPIKKYFIHAAWFLIAGAVMWISISNVFTQKSVGWKTIFIEIAYGGIIYIVFTILFLYMCYKKEISLFIKRRMKLDKQN